MVERNTYDKAFLQIGGIWSQSEIAREFVLSRKLGRIAAELMGVRGVRRYHDQALYKEAGGGFTPWHADQYYWPLLNSNTCTVWIPLQPTPLAMGPLAFAAASHTFEGGRNLQISDESEAILQQKLTQQNFRYVESSYDLGEVSYHYGWTYHRAAPNRTNSPRAVMTVIYMDDEIRVAPRSHNHQDQLRDTRVGEVPDTPNHPIIYRA